MAMSNIMLPEVLNDFNVYMEGEKLIGQNADVEMPEFNFITDTLSGSGIMGEIEDPVTGLTESASIKFKWNCLQADYFDLVNTTRPTTITLRGSQQMINKSTFETDYYPTKVLVRGKSKSIKLGTWEKGKKQNCETEIEIFYFKVIVDNKILIEIDKLNSKFILNGEDLRAKINSQI